MAGQPIRELVERSCAGDREAYASLLCLHYKRVYLLCFGLVTDVHQAEDIAQEAFLSGFVKIGQLKKPSLFAAWIGRIAHNMCMDHLKNRKTMVALNQDLPAPVSDDPDVDALRFGIRKLPMELRLPLVLYYLDGQEVKTVAEILNTSVSTAYVRFRTAVRELYQTLKENEV